MPGARPSAVLLLTAAAVVGCGEREAERVPAAPAVPAEHSAPAGPPADEWPGLHGPRFDNSAPADGLTWDWPPGGPPVAWRRPCGTGYAAPVVAGGRVVLLHRVGPDVGPRADAAAALGGDEPREVLQWFDLDTGEPGPSAAVPATFESDYPGHSGAPYATPAVGRRGPDGRRRVYAHGAGGVLRAVDLETAEPLWSRDLAAETRPAAKPFATASSPLVLPPVDSQDGAGGGERVVVATGGAEPNTGLTCLDGATGETVWQSVDAAESYSSPVPVVLRDPETGDPESGRRAILALMKTRLLVADARTGEELGSLPFELRTVDAMNAASPVVAGEIDGDPVVFVGSGPSGRTAGCMAARVRPDGSLEELWRNRRGLDPQYNSLAAAGGFVYGFGSNLNRQQKLRCLDVSTGELAWVWNGDLPGAADDDAADAAGPLRRGNLVRAGGVLVCLGERGELAAVAADPAGPRVLAAAAEPVVAGPCYTTPVLAGGRLLVRTEGELVCLDLRAGR